MIPHDKNHPCYGCYYYEDRYGYSCNKLSYEFYEPAPEPEGQKRSCWVDPRSK